MSTPPDGSENDAVTRYADLATARGLLKFTISIGQAFLKKFEFADGANRAEAQPLLDQLRPIIDDSANTPTTALLNRQPTAGKEGDLIARLKGTVGKIENLITQLRAYEKPAEVEVGAGEEGVGRDTLDLRKKVDLLPDDSTTKGARKALGAVLSTIKASIEGDARLKNSDPAVAAAVAALKANREQAKQFLSMNTTPDATVDQITKVTEELSKKLSELYTLVTERENAAAAPVPPANTEAHTLATFTLPAMPTIPGTVEAMMAQARSVSQFEAAINGMPSGPFKDAKLALYAVAAKTTSLLKALQKHPDADPAINIVVATACKALENAYNTSKVFLVANENTSVAAIDQVRAVLISGYNQLAQLATLALIEPETAAPTPTAAAEAPVISTADIPDFDTRVTARVAEINRENPVTSENANKILKILARANAENTLLQQAIAANQFLIDYKIVNGAAVNIRALQDKYGYTGHPGPLPDGVAEAIVLALATAQVINEHLDGLADEIRAAAHEKAKAETKSKLADPETGPNAEEFAALKQELLLRTEAELISHDSVKGDFIITKAQDEIRSRYIDHTDINQANGLISAVAWHRIHHPDLEVNLPEQVQAAAAPAPAPTPIPTPTDSTMATPPRETDLSILRAEVEVTSPSELRTAKLQLFDVLDKIETTLIGSRALSNSTDSAVVNGRDSLHNNRTAAIKLLRTDSTPAEQITATTNALLTELNQLLELARTPVEAKSSELTDADLRHATLELASLNDKIPDYAAKLTAAGRRIAEQYGPKFTDATYDLAREQLALLTANNQTLSLGKKIVYDEAHTRLVEAERETYRSTRNPIDAEIIKSRLAQQIVYADHFADLTRTAGNTVAPASSTILVKNNYGLELTAAQVGTVTDELNRKYDLSNAKDFGRAVYELATLQVDNAIVFAGKPVSEAERDKRISNVLPGLERIYENGHETEADRDQLRTRLAIETAASKRLEATKAPPPQPQAESTTMAIDTSKIPDFKARLEKARDQVKREYGSASSSNRHNIVSDLAHLTIGNQYKNAHLKPEGEKYDSDVTKLLKGDIKQKFGTNEQPKNIAALLEALALQIAIAVHFNDLEIAARIPTPSPTQAPDLTKIPGYEDKLIAATQDLHREFGLKPDPADTDKMVQRLSLLTVQNQFSHQGKPFNETEVNAERKKLLPELTKRFGTSANPINTRNLTSEIVTQYIIAYDVRERGQAAIPAAGAQQQTQQQSTTGNTMSNTDPNSKPAPAADTTATPAPAPAENDRIQIDLSKKIPAPAASAADPNQAKIETIRINLPPKPASLEAPPTVPLKRAPAPAAPATPAPAVEKAAAALPPKPAPAASAAAPATPAKSGAGVTQLEEAALLGAASAPSSVDTGKGGTLAPSKVEHPAKVLVASTAPTAAPKKEVAQPSAAELAQKRQAAIAAKVAELGEPIFEKGTFGGRKAVKAEKVDGLILQLATATVDLETAQTVNKGDITKIAALTKQVDGLREELKKQTTLVEEKDKTLATNAAELEKKLAAAKETGKTEGAAELQKVQGKLSTTEDALTKARQERDAAQGALKKAQAAAQPAQTGSTKEAEQEEALGIQAAQIETLTQEKQGLEQKLETTQQTLEKSQEANKSLQRQKSPSLWRTWGIPVVTFVFGGGLTGLVGGHFTRQQLDAQIQKDGKATAAAVTKADEDRRQSDIKFYSEQEQTMVNKAVIETADGIVGAVVADVKDDAKNHTSKAPVAIDSLKYLRDIAASVKSSHVEDAKDRKDQQNSATNQK